MEPGVFTHSAKKACNLGMNGVFRAPTSPLLPGLPVPMGNSFLTPGDTWVKPWSVTFDCLLWQISTVASSIAPAGETTLVSTSPSLCPQTTWDHGSQPR